ncbi:MAG: hypothetical protein GX444_20170 [Myxococcales bacterium]|nr:hypothetical protein [Myxococcales bacterium]
MPQPQVQLRQLPPLVVWILWFSLLMSIFFYVGISFVVPPVTTAAESAGQYAPLRWAFLGVGLLLTVMSFLFPRLLARRAAFFVAYLIRWAFADAIACLGLLLFFLAEPAPIFYLFAGWAIVLDLLAMPTAGARTRYADLAGTTEAYNRSDRP